ncbi:Maf-like protein [Oesophagostomum dentatum]|uniref:Maf-like protein n=1 Tax=Oesophagostomum dentatum TaxID=61180 RepID=A0A0B1TJI1_OESDE|nr:Maf-like protein [Oesophagostomum dentatum]
MRMKKEALLSYNDGILNPLIRVSNFEENLPKTLPVREFVEQTALGKLHAVVEEMKKNKEKYDVIIASDTVIYFNGEIVGKPADAKDAFLTLQRLRGREHLVYSGVALAYADGSEEVFSEETRVEFGDFPDRIIQQYVDSGEPL